MSEFAAFLSRTDVVHQVTNIKNAGNDKLTFICLHTDKNQPLLALVDSGASLSLIVHDTAIQIGLTSVGSASLSLQGFHDESTSVSHIFPLRLKIHNSVMSMGFLIAGHAQLPSTQFLAPVLSDNDKNCLDLLKIDHRSITAQKTHNGKPIDMILGNDVLASLYADSHTKRHQLPSRRVIDSTRIGCIVHPVPSMVIHTEENHTWILDETIKPAHSIMHADMVLSGQSAEDPDLQLHWQIEQMWKLENIGIEPIPLVDSSKMSTKDLLAEFENTVQYSNGQLEVALPFNGNESKLKNNYAIAYQRLKSLIQTLTKGTSLIEKYHKVIMDQKLSNIIERVTPEMAQDSPIEYFMPHRAVIKESSNTTKLRVVLDASSPIGREFSLNDCLHAGTNLVTPLFGILIRARCYRYIIVSDIEKAFHQVRLQKAFRNVTQFLWIQDPSKPTVEDNLCRYRFTRIPFGVASSPFLLAAAILHFLARNPHRLNSQIRENLYVDNCLLGTNEFNEIMKTAMAAKAIFKKMEMNLREFVVNESIIMDRMKAEDKAESREIKLLGYTWNSNDKVDSLSVKIAVLDIEHPTKRQVASKMAETFDPLGLVSPLQVLFKRLIQQIWISGVKWKDKIPVELLPMWKELQQAFIDKSVHVPRRLTFVNDECEEIHLLVFTDASQDVYAATVYAHHIYKKWEPVTTHCQQK